MEIKQISGKYYEVIAKVNVDDAIGKVTVAVDALSFTEAEAKGTEYHSTALQEIVNINPALYTECFIGQDESCTTYYKVKVDVITINEQNGKEKKQGFVYLVFASSVKQAEAIVNQVLGNTMLNYRVGAVVETKISDIVYG